MPIMEEQSDRKKDFVNIMLEKAENEDPEPKPNTADEDSKEIEHITNNIRRRIQER